MRSVGAALPRTLKSLGISRRTREAQALWLWPQLVGPHLARETSALKLTGGTLWVSATSPALAHQLHLERGMLIERLNEGIGVPAVREIRFRQAGPGLASPSMTPAGRRPWR
jgi:hypothetical protein